MGKVFKCRDEGRTCIIRCVPEIIGMFLFKCVLYILRLSASSRASAVRKHAKMNSHRCVYLFRIIYISCMEYNRHVHWEALPCQTKGSPISRRRILRQRKVNNILFCPDDVNQKRNIGKPCSTSASWQTMQYIGLMANHAVHRPRGKPCSTSASWQTMQYIGLICMFYARLNPCTCIL
jgi:hypothetical protein